MTTTRRNFLKSASIAGVLTTFLSPVSTYGSMREESGKTHVLETEEKDEYLAGIKAELIKEWPNNRTVNLVFHGHSVPSGYFRTPDVETFQSYPFLLLKELKKIYPFAVINVILTCIGGENSEQGAKRFKKQVLNHRPDVLFVDYALNDRRISIEASHKAMEYMIKEGLKKKMKIILLTSTPDQKVDIKDKETDLQKLNNQLIDLAKKYQIGLVDNYAAFQKLVSSGEKIADYMSQVNHPNEKGHQVVANGIMKYF
ncbi:MAG: SGNH/GDSL hydrolase family protein [Prolixibacteraceae bacterium]|nr:SGNH/GDSL hydrolase family protein [Prolixibacteraceae bacterium]